MTSSNNEREQLILTLADGLLTSINKGGDIDEAKVDAEFLFRFEVTWCTWVSLLRTMMRELLKQSGDAPLSVEDGARLLIHLDSNVGLRVGMQLGNGSTKLTIENSRGAYHILDEALQEKNNAFVKHSLVPIENQTEHENEIEQLWHQLWLEANQTSKIQYELERLIRSYCLVPADGELGEYPVNQVKKQYGNVRNWVLWGLYTPPFFYERTMLIENKMKDRVGRIVRPCKWPNNQPFSKERLPLATRIRTWAIYYLTQRGGGKLKELAAVELWNDRFPERKVDPAYYEDNRTKLFALGTGKGLVPSLGASFKNVNKHWALLIGINQYNDVMFGPLNFCVRDVEEISNHLVSGGFDQDCMNLITDSSDDPPKRLSILQTLKSIADSTSPDDLLFFYFSGHGIEENGESYLVPKDVNHFVIQDSAVPISRVKEIMIEAPARAKVIVLDACHSGIRISGKGDKRMSDAFIHRVFEQAEGIAILSSCKQGEVSYELPTQNHSVFTHFLLKALEGESDRDGKGFVTVQDVNLYVLDNVTQWTAQNMCNQTPTFQAATIGDIPLVRY
jgi:hypothetical protein